MEKCQCQIEIGLVCENPAQNNICGEWYCEICKDPDWLYDDTDEMVGYICPEHGGVWILDESIMVWY